MKLSYRQKEALVMFSWIAFWAFFPILLCIYFKLILDFIAYWWKL